MARSLDKWIVQTILLCLTVVLLGIFTTKEVRGQNNPAHTILDDIYHALQVADPHAKDEGWAYGLTQGNSLEGDWLIQTPRWWGGEGVNLPVAGPCVNNCYKDLNLQICRGSLSEPENYPSCDGIGGVCTYLQATVALKSDSAGAACLGHSDRILDYFYNTITSASTIVDITTLDFPTGRFLGALKYALTNLADSGKSVHVRIQIGEVIKCGSDLSNFVHPLTEWVDPIPHSKIVVTVVCANYGITQWNHAKIVAADGRIALVGGHNMWTQDYLLKAPIHDLSMMAHGPAAKIAQEYASHRWVIPCQAWAGNNRYIYSYNSQTGQSGSTCPNFPAIPTSSGTGSADILVVSTSPGSGRSPNSYGDIARIAAFNVAKTNIQMSQQDIAWRTNKLSQRYWPEKVLEALAQALLRGVTVEVVLSNYGATSGAGTSYENGIPLEIVASVMRQTVAAQPHAPTGHDLDILMCDHFYLSPLRYSADEEWPGGHKIGNHAKFWMVDESVFYIGSNNVYPAHLDELGFIVDDQGASSWISQWYWEKLVDFSDFAGLNGVGTDPNDCWFYHN